MTSAHVSRRLIQQGSQRPLSSGHLRQQEARKGWTQQCTKQHSHRAQRSTVPSPAGLSDDRGSIIEGKIRLVSHPLEVLPSSYHWKSKFIFIFNVPQRPTQGSDQGHATAYEVQCYQRALSQRKEGPFTPVRQGLEGTTRIPPLVPWAEYKCIFPPPSSAPSEP